MSSNLANASQSEVLSFAKTTESFSLAMKLIFGEAIPILFLQERNQKVFISQPFKIHNRLSYPFWEDLFISTLEVYHFFEVCQDYLNCSYSF
ncbi:hypothetical protein JYB64_18620 [Algoriphagus aestuarii]|nr:hypothetical protein [Algoriphagus aestuarii]